MNRQETYKLCNNALESSNFILLELPTGYGKSKLSIDLVNHLATDKYKEKPVSVLLLVAKTVHKQTWKDEISKWGGLKANTLTIECYESLKKHLGETFDIIVMDEVHHLNSELRLELFSSISFGSLIGLSATIPQKLKRYLQYTYHAEIVSCDIVEAIEDEVLPEPQILLFPLKLDNKILSETIILNPKAKGQTTYCTYNEYWKHRKSKNRVVMSCTEKQKIQYLNSQILWQKNFFTKTRAEYMKNRWLFTCGERLKCLAYFKNNLINRILYKLAKERTITFCKTIEQSEYLGKFCIHSKNKEADEVYADFNQKKINHITAVNILNENANLVDCKYAIFANLSSSEVVIPQRLGRAMRHKSPVIIIPYYEDTREEEIVLEMFKSYNVEFINIIHSIDEI